MLKSKKIAVSLLFYFVIFSFFSLTIPAQAKVELVPLIDLKLGGGNSYFEGESSSFGGNLELNFVPAIRLGKKTSFLPRYSVNYSGYRLAVELEDEESLYQESSNHLLSFKLIHKILPDFKFRAEYGYKRELLKETRDTSWGDGLYDYNSPYTNIEIEKKFQAKASPSLLFGGGFRIYDISYPNYQSLASQVDLELIGENVLDSKNKDIFINGEIFWNPTYFTKWGYTFTQSEYTDQKIVTISGEYSEEERSDEVHNFNIGLNFSPEKEYYLDFAGDSIYKLYSGIDLILKKKLSNQNHFDTEYLMPVSHFYSYNQLKLVPFVTFKFIPSNTNLSLTYEFSHKKYPHRIAQDATGNYTNDKLLSRGHTFAIKVSSPINERVWVEVVGSYRDTSSNMKYEKFYNYNYSSAHYSLGIRYEY